MRVSAVTLPYVHVRPLSSPARSPPPRCDPPEARWSCCGDRGPSRTPPPAAPGLCANSWRAILAACCADAPGGGRWQLGAACVNAWRGHVAGASEPRPERFLLLVFVFCFLMASVRSRTFSPSEEPSNSLWRRGRRIPFA